jgi:small subunit ribosomal protein S6
MRTYELVMLMDPRLSDEEVLSLTEDQKKMITTGGAEVVKEENWGKRKLAYPIGKLNEGKYVLLGVKTEEKNPLPGVELRLRQNDKVLRYLTVRTDQDRMPPPRPPGEAPVVTERPEYTARGDRPDRSERFDRGGGGGDRGDRFDRGGGDRADRFERSDRGFGGEGR